MMNRRQFMAGTSAAIFVALLEGPTGAAWQIGEQEFEMVTWRHMNTRYKSGPAPLAEITAAVDVIVPADPEVPNDFKGSDYGGDWVLAGTLGSAGQIAMKVMLDRYSKQVNGKKFMAANDDERIEAIRQWIREREEVSPLILEMLTGLLTISMIGTFEANDKEERERLFETMGWYDPEDPAGTFRVPCEGYPDSHIWPVRLKKGFSK